MKLSDMFYNFADWVDGSAEALTVCAGAAGMGALLIAGTLNGAAVTETGPVNQPKSFTSVEQCVEAGYAQPPCRVSWEKAANGDSKAVITFQHPARSSSSSSNALSQTAITAHTVSRSMSTSRSFR